jgi:hypothetical protein
VQLALMPVWLAMGFWHEESAIRTSAALPRLWIRVQEQLSMSTSILAEAQPTLCMKASIVQSSCLSDGQVPTLCDAPANISLVAAATITATVRRPPLQ